MLRTYKTEINPTHKQKTKNNHTDWTKDRHLVKIPALGFIQPKEKGYIPAKNIVKSSQNFCNNQPKTEEIVIDLQIKNLAKISNTRTFKNINKSNNVKKLEKKLKREQKRLLRKHEHKKKRGEKTAAYSANIAKQVKKVQVIHMKLANIRKNYTNKVINEIVKTKPSHITIEDLNVRGMMKNRHLAKAVGQQNFYYFKQKMEQKSS